ncbi:MAG: hypothetical protein DRO11_07495 [Methanobacteriota archaeon]|nr:MAG: hypothetical protein DRO11_07495 [Euryarchaeota archaeon]
MPLLYHSLGKTGFTMLVAFLLIVSITVDVLRRKKLLGEKIEEINRVFGSRWEGHIYFLLGTLIVTLLTEEGVLVAAILMLTLGDGAAALIGTKFGRHKIKKNKSVEGSLACFLACIATSMFISNFYGVDLEALLAGALVATATETFSTRLDDNLTIPIATGLTIQLIQNI